MCHQVYHRVYHHWTFNMNRQINNPCRYQQNITKKNNPRTSPKLKQTRTLWKQNTKSSTHKQDSPHSKHSNNVYVPLKVDSLGKNSKFIKNSQNAFIKYGGIELPSWTHQPKKTWKSSGNHFMRAKGISTIKTQTGFRNKESSSIASLKQHIAR